MHFNAEKCSAVFEKVGWEESSLNKEAAVVNNEHGWSIYNYRVSQRD